MRLIRDLPETELQAAERFLAFLQNAAATTGGHRAQPGGMPEEDRRWLEADMGGDLPPFDWGAGGPPEVRPVRYARGVGLIVDDLGVTS